MEKLSNGWKILIYSSLLVWVLIIISVIVSDEENPIETETQKVEKHFNPWDGSHIKLSRIIKENLKDPDSYEHIETTYRIEGDTVLVFTNYRAKNSFGGYVVEEITGITDKNTGEVIDWIRKNE